jgi:folate-binding Fe-S cluster repair protein YgfZ
VVWPAADDELLLACSADLLPATLKRLSMFVLRAKCKLSDASADWPLWGLAGTGTGPARATAACALGRCRQVHGR